jgi:Zn-dependent peptidase ImmA (M78 family)/transcriptional regulator with XRE-family HTH domain
MTRSVEPEEFGARVRTARTGARMNQQQLAEAAQVSQASVSRIESGRRGASLMEADKIADVLGVPLEALLYGSPVRERVQVALRAEGQAYSDALEPGLDLLVIDDQLDAATSDLRQQPRPTSRPPNRGSPAAVGQTLAGQVREALGLGVGPVLDVVALIEELTGVDVATVRLDGLAGMTVHDPDRDTTFVVSNSAEPAERQRFAQAHELGHLLLGHGTHVDRLSDLQDGNDQDEKRCNEFARNLLAPREGVRSWLARNRPELSGTVDEAALAGLTRYFGVSSGAMRIQLCRMSRWPDALGAASTRVLATRYGWLAEYQARRAAAEREQAPRRLIERALRACAAGAAAPSLVARLTKQPLAEVEALISQLALPDGIENFDQSVEQPAQQVRFARLPTARERAASSS